jgi:GNAT superfamily N-acetyltransferase
MSRSTELDPGAVVVSDDPSRVDVEVVWQFLSTTAYWGRWRARDDVEAQIRGAWRVVGAYASDGAMVGFAWAFSDGVSGAYLADVFVLPAWRGRGVGRQLVEEMVENGPGREFRWMLHTADAHDLYGAFGFVAPNASYLERPASPDRARLVWAPE